MKQEHAIEVRNMSKSFKIQSDKANSIKNLIVQKRKNVIKRHEVLNDINLDIRKGETVCLIGNNGCGKSTLLRLMTRIIYPNKGTVTTSGRVASLLELGAGFHPDFTGRENIYFNSAVFGMNHRQIDERIDHIIEFSELGSFIDEPIRTYSSGMYMRLAFSIAINVDADILLIDEILAVGDQHFQDKCYAKLQELKKQADKTIVIVSHSLGIVKQLCDRAIWIYKGKVKLDGDPTYVIAEYLEQMAKDHKEEKRQAELEGKKVDYKGIIFVEAPRDYTTVTEKKSRIDVVGWKLCDYEDCLFEATAGNKTIDNISYFERNDVLMVYGDDYSGFVKEDEIGWKFSVDLKEYKDQLEENGALRFRMYLKKKDGSVITEQSSIVVYEESNL